MYPCYLCEFSYLQVDVFTKKRDAEAGLAKRVSLIAESRYFEANKEYKRPLTKLSDLLFINIELWLKTGVIAPKTTSLLERVFREIGRRLKKIAWGWSDTAVTNISKMIMTRQYSRDKWDKYWKEKLGIKGYFDIEIVSVTS